MNDLDSRKLLDSTQDPDLTGALPKEILQAPIETFVEALGDPSQLPSRAIALCLMRYTEAGPLLREALERAALDALTDDRDALVFYRGLHIIGGRRDPLAFEPLLRFLRRPGDDVEALLGDGMSFSLPRIVIGVYDGNALALFDTIVDPAVDERVRDSLLLAAAFIAWEGRIERALMVAFLDRFHRDRLAPDGDLAWDAWVASIALLGLREMVPALEAALARGAFEFPWDRAYFDEVLDHAEQAPDDITEFEEQSLGYIDDVLATLEGDLALESEDDDKSMYPGVEPSGWLPPIPQPVINPMRHVGRNDPCPCGSGKKAKRCCLAA